MPQKPEAYTPRFEAVSIIRGEKGELVNEKKEEGGAMQRIEVLGI